ncbi:MAG: hypothetical protein M1826_000156 [Phylliscum demangeonii]|nr:MAG: hypothetical protein M1826_000156 [Phylliscum demangeonii]
MPGVVEIGDKPDSLAPKKHSSDPYTPEQLDLLKAQKKKVAEVIAATHHAARTKETDPTDADLGLTTAHEHEHEPKHDHKPEPEPQSTGPFRTANDPVALPRCGWMCCCACRPLLLERAWISLNAVTRLEFIPEVVPELLWPPVSQRDVVQNLGLRPVALFGRLVKRLSSHSRRARAASEKQAGGAPYNGNRARFYKAFKGHRYRHRRMSYHLMTDLQLLAYRNSILAGAERLPVEQDGSRQTSEAVLQAATETKLPGKDGEDGLELELELELEPEGAVVEVEGGVAVTEEAVTQRTEDGLQLELEPEGAVVEVEGGVAVTEEAVTQGTADVLMTEDAVAHATADVLMAEEEVAQVTADVLIES